MTQIGEEFLKAASKDEAIREALGALNNVDEKNRIAEMLMIAKRFGYDLTEQDLAMEETTGEIALEEMQAVAAGDGGSCNCVFAGGGSTDSAHSGTCVCISNGAGVFSAPIFGPDGNTKVDKKTTGWCACAGLGHGG